MIICVEVKLVNNYKKMKEKFKNSLKKRPISVFLVLLLILFGLIFAGNKLREPKSIDGENQEEMQKKVSVFKFNETPRISVQAKIDKENVVQLVAQKNGIVSGIYTKAGQKVYRGRTMAYISDTQFGENISVVALEVAKKQQEASDENIERQKKIFKKQKQIIDRTPSPTSVLDLQEEIDKKQISINKENANLANDLSELGVKQAQIAAQMSRVSAPQNGIVEKVYVNPGQFVSVGAPIMLFRADKGSTFAEVKVPFEIAELVSVQQKSYLQLGKKEIEAYPVYISSEATDAYLYSILYCIPSEDVVGLADDSFVSVSLPLEIEVSGDDFFPLVPLDAIQLTQDKNFVFVLEEGQAKVREVELGNVISSYVEVLSGLGKRDEVIINRNVFDGDRVFAE